MQKKCIICLKPTPTEKSDYCLFHRNFYMRPGNVAIANKMVPFADQGSGGYHGRKHDTNKL